MNRPPAKHGRLMSSSPGLPGAHSSQPSLSASAHGPRQYEPGTPRGLLPALLPAELNHAMPWLTALSTTWAIGPVPLPAPSYWAVSERLTMSTPFDPK